MDMQSTTMERERTATTAADPRQELSRKTTDIEATARFLTFEPGLYAIEFRSAASSMSDVGLPLPCARLESVVVPNNPGRAFISMNPEGGWLSRGTVAAHVFVVGGRAGAVLTIYRPTDGTPMPEVQFRAVVPAGAPPRPAAPEPIDGPAAAGPGARILVHVEGAGDRTLPAGEWVGDLTGQRAIEGFALLLPAAMAVSDVEYQGIMGEDWRTPWFEAGSFCGSRGLQLPLLGFRLRLVGDAARRYECRAHGQFARLGTVGPVASGEDCHGETMPLTAMRVEITLRQPAGVEPQDAPGREAVKKPRSRRARPG